MKKIMSNSINIRIWLNYKSLKLNVKLTQIIPSSTVCYISPLTQQKPLSNGFRQGDVKHITF
jgi:hypothetical protein